MSLGYKVPFRQYYAQTFGGWLKGCWTCFWATVGHKLGFS
jgi:hypothetical protein